MMVSEEGMTTEEINQCMKNKKTFYGVFPSDLIPILPNHRSVIVNNHDSRNPGAHWIALYRKNKDTVFLF